MKEVYIQGKRVRINPALLIGEGGEAEVYDISQFSPETVLKIWKLPDHPDFVGTDEVAVRNREGAKRRLIEQQQKIREFPKGLPASVISPQDLALTRDRQSVVGYTMGLVSGAEALREYSQIGFRNRSMYTNNDMVELFQRLHSIVAELHAAGMVIGDFNNLNVLVRDLIPFIIDADSMQFGSYPCRTFTARYVDPLVCDPKLTKLLQVASHSQDSDWYAYALMLFETLLMVHPFGGIYRPGNGKNIPRDQRPLLNISVLNPEVIYPKKGIPFGHLPDDLLHHFDQMLHSNLRGEFPLDLLRDLRWTNCTACGVVHARSVCPNCAAAGVVKEIIAEIIKGEIIVQKIFETEGVILRAAFQDGKLRYLYHQDGEFRRESGNKILSGTPNPKMRYRIRGDETLIAMPGQMIKLSDQPEKLPVDSFRGLAPIFDSNARNSFWISQGRLWRDDKFGPKELGSVLPGQTWFRAGPKFGFGFYKAGELQVSFVFDSQNGNLNDQVKLPTLKGAVLDANCCFTEDRCWFFVTLEQGGKSVNHVYVLRADGEVVAHAEAEEGDAGWLGSVSGKTAVTFRTDSGHAHCLFAATEEGIVRVQESGGKIVLSAEFPDTEDFVSPTDSLFFSKQGLYVVSESRVSLIKFAS